MVSDAESLELARIDQFISFIFSDAQGICKIINVYHKRHGIKIMNFVILGWLLPKTLAALEKLLYLAT